jgi:hypothetical protein
MSEPSRKQLRKMVNKEFPKSKRKEWIIDMLALGSTKDKGEKSRA